MYNKFTKNRTKMKKIYIIQKKKNFIQKTTDFTLILQNLQKL